jgi:hypothetical protein
MTQLAISDMAELFARVYLAYQVNLATRISNTKVDIDDETRLQHASMLHDSKTLTVGTKDNLTQYEFDHGQLKLKAFIDILADEYTSEHIKA